jgi:hypothetical protein
MEERSMGEEEDTMMMTSELLYEVGGTLCLQQKLVRALLGK